MAVPGPDEPFRLVPNIKPVPFVKKYLSFAQSENAVLDVHPYNLWRGAKPLESSEASKTAFEIQSSTVGMLQVRPGTAASALAPDLALKRTAVCLAAALLIGCTSSMYQYDPEIGWLSCGIAKGILDEYFYMHATALSCCSLPSIQHTG